MGTKLLRRARHFMMQCQMTLMMEGDNYNIDDYDNANTVDAGYENRNVDSS